MAKKIGGLGKGLSAIFSENDTEDKNEVVTLKISQIEPNRNQPRRTFDEDALQELALSISEHGVLQPILVRPMIYGGYQIVAGERRYRASRMAGLTEIPAIVRELTDSETMQIALIENLQRSDLTTLEEAMGYQTLMDEYDFSQEDVARIVGKSRSAVANTLRLLSLPDEVKDLLEQGKLSAGHARALLIVEDDKIAVDTARKIVSDGLSVRETEKLVKKTESAAPQKKKTSSVKKVTAYTEVELALTTALGTKVTVTENKNKKGGTLNIEFYDPEELFALTHKLEKLWE
ncbi:MAG: ParB/RepB/Spo0J family partition protein [Ruminococcus sp.]|nr:ParB/RepB/Spo0J family partition protein [Ruminococcus sp.]MBQ1898458.1 ParB/RepB/Spo0J family partition protein [Ruminococcus sp.]MBQ4238878.1 ParB/RepB/Spo0J family partition protein [Ruminococcus sp.]